MVKVEIPIIVGIC